MLSSGVINLGAIPLIHLETHVVKLTEQLAYAQLVLLSSRVISLQVNGLANLLAFESVSYAEFARAFSIVVGTDQDSSLSQVTFEALELALLIKTVFTEAREKAASLNTTLLIKTDGSDCTSNWTYNKSDRLGYKTVPGIFPPSSAELLSFGYPPYVESLNALSDSQVKGLLKAWKSLIS